MLAMERIGYIFGGFAALMALVYGVWNDWAEPIGTVVPRRSARCSGFMIAGYLNITRRKLDGVPPEDDPLGEISDIAGDYGFFSPLQLVAALARLARARSSSSASPSAGGSWPWAPFFVVPALVGWVFEYWKGPHAL